MVSMGLSKGEPHAFQKWNDLSDKIMNSLLFLGEDLQKDFFPLTRKHKMFWNDLKIRNKGRKLFNTNKFKLELWTQNTLRSWKNMTLFENKYDCSWKINVRLHLDS